MPKLIDFRHGMTFHANSKDSVFVRDFKKILTYLGIKYTDPCCPTGDCSPLDFVSPLYPAGPIEYLTDADGDQTVSLLGTNTNIDTTDGTPSVTLTVPNATTQGHVKIIRWSGLGSQVNIHLNSIICGTEDTDYSITSDFGSTQLIWNCNCWVRTDWKENQS